MRQKRLNYEGSVVVVFGGSFLGQIVSKSPCSTTRQDVQKLRDLFEVVFETYFFSSALMYYARANESQ